MKNDVWVIVPKPEGKSMVPSKWIYKINHGNVKGLIMPKHAKTRPVGSCTTYKKNKP